jgi:hypothetical protein
VWLCRLVHASGSVLASFVLKGPGYEGNTFRSVRRVCDVTRVFLVVCGGFLDILLGGEYGGYTCFFEGPG